MKTKELNKQELYESVKALVECDSAHIHLSQHKLYTLVSIGFQYLLYRSTKSPGLYILRFEDHSLFEKVCRKAKDPGTRKFLEQIGKTRRWKYQNSIFFLDYFQMSSWIRTDGHGPKRPQGALIVKNTSPTPLVDSIYLTELQELRKKGAELDNHHYLSCLQKLCPHTIMISNEGDYPNTKEITFSFIKNTEASLQGVRINEDFKFNES